MSLFNGKSKIVLAYGISKRDKYIILKEHVCNINKLKWFLSTCLSLFMFENYKYRMCFLEKAGFECLVDISLLKDEEFPFYNEEEMLSWFGFTDKDKNYVRTFERKQF